MMQSNHKILKSVIRIRNALHYSDQSGCKMEFTKRYEYKKQYLSIVLLSEIGYWYSIRLASTNYSMLRFDFDHNTLVIRGENQRGKPIKIIEDDLKDIVDMDDLSIVLTYRKDLTDSKMLDYSFKGAEDLFLDFEKSKIFESLIS